MTIKSLCLALALVAGGLSAAQAQGTSTPGAPAGDSSGNAATGSTAAPSGK